MADRPGSSPSGDPPGSVAAGGTADGDRDAAFDAIATVMRSVFGVPFVAFALAGPERPAARARGGTEAEGSPEARFCRHAVLEQRVLEVADAAADARLAGHPAVAGRPSIRGFLGTPLATAEGYTFGALGVIDTRPRRFAATDAALLRQFAEVVASMLELRRIASRDMLTGALTRRAFEDAARRELARCRRHGTPVSLALFDLDHFKAINDTFGHAAGDDVLRTVALTCAETMRESDTLGRVGGEEFAVLLVGAGQVEARASLERLRRAIERARVLERPELAFTASFGAAEFEPRFASVGEWMAAADACLYAAKRTGRNRCVIEGAAPAPVARAGTSPVPLFGPR
jgi:diguanylate cyclase (GGDEF)-like protein